ncbi:MAG TPA: hypothetical protein VGI35_09350, partial [Steroidobacteraceae bacterium]
DGPSTRPVWSVPPESVIVSAAPETVIPISRARESIAVWGRTWADAGVSRRNAVHRVPVRLRAPG